MTSEYVIGSEMFQSTRPYGARRARCRSSLSAQSFNPRARMGRDDRPKLLGGYPRVSIHAPVWGATSMRPGRFQRSMVSIHAPVWGATMLAPLYGLEAAVSIHAPVWGATICDCSRVTSGIVSIHAPVWGATTLYLFACWRREFQSTRPYGARRRAGVVSGAGAGFNPRARMGRDPRQAGNWLREEVSIHAPVWGAT